MWAEVVVAESREMKCERVLKIVHFVCCQSMMLS